MRGSTALRYIALAAAFAAGIAAARVCWNHIKLPFSNPWHIIGAPSVMQFNPNINRIGYACMVSIPCILLLALYLAPIRRLKALLFLRECSQPTKTKKAAKPVERVESVPKRRLGVGLVLKLSLVLLLMIISLACPSDYAAHRFDTFHEGESLGPAISYLHGGVPYKDFYVLHGFIQDCGKVALAFKLFGRSIASVRTLWSIVKVVTFGLIGILFLMLFEGQVLWAISAGLLFALACVYPITVGNDVFQPVARIWSRDITTLLFLVAALGLHGWLMRGAKSSTRGLAVVSSLPAFLAVAALGFSVDRGTFLTASYFVVFAVLYAGLVRGTPPRRQIAYVAGSLGGAGAGLLALGILVQWNLAGFFQFTYGVLPRLFAMMDTLAFPIAKPQWLAVVALVAFNAYWLLLKFLQSRQAEMSFGEFCRKYFPETALLTVSLTMFLAALGISDWDHVSIDAVPAYFLFLTIIFKHVLPGLLGNGGVRTAYAYLVGVLAICALGWGINTVSSYGLIRSNFPLGKPDFFYVSAEDAEAVAFLKGHLGPGENFFTMTSEGSWYYLLDKPCPTHFVMAYAAGSDACQEQTVQDLEAHNVKYIIVHNDWFSNAIRGVPTLARLPVVTQYIQTNYEPCVTIGSQKIWVRKGSNTRE